jgi:plasmid stabilization system protein ParE
MKLRFTAAAEADLEAIGDWIAKDNPARALSFVKELRSACATTLDAPEGYPLVERYKHRGIWRKVHGNYLIFYRIKSDAVEIIHVLHGARDYEPILFEE